MTAPRLVDWDGDGDMDLIAGSFGASWGEGKGGAVYLSRNNGQNGKPAFGKLETLIPPSPKGHQQPTRPDAGLYVDAVDYDGDGDLDLVVGGYSMWTPEVRQLNDEETATVARLQEEQKLLRSRQSELSTKMRAEATEATAGLERNSDEARAKTTAVYAGYRDQTSAFAKEGAAITEQLDELVARPQRKSFVWLYERLSAAQQGG
jgi:hypothetical protein